MKIDKELMEKVAKNAKIEIINSNDFILQLNDILDYFKVLDELETKDVEPCFHPIEIKNVMRDDVVEEGFSQDETLCNSEQKKDGYFKGPKVV